jgi:fibronectin type 3 domain-containing protein
VVAYDAYGNFSQPSDTAFTKTYEAKDVLAPQYFITASNSQERAIQLKWKLVNEMSVSAIQIFRSTDYEGKFDLIGYATPFDTTYADNTVKPATVYYYYLQLMDRFQKNSFRSARAYGMLDDTRAPRPVRYVNAERENGKVKVSWVTADKNISGYYVYRAVGLDTANYLQVSEFIEAKDSLTVWFDETKDLSSPYGYNYIVKQENTSRVLSRASQYAYLESAISAADVPSVMQLEVKVNAGKPILFWESLQTVTGVTGYHVLRKTNGQKDFELLTKTPLSSAINFFADSTVKPGNVYEYAIQTVMVSGEKNTSANTATFSLAFGSPSAPSAPSLTIGKEGVMVSWAKGNSVPVKEYQVFRAEQGAQQAEKLVSVPVSFSSYIDSKAIKGKSYYYYLIAVGIDNVESERGAINFIAYE